MFGKLITQGDRAAVTLDVLGKDTAGIFAIFIEEFGREQRAINNIPSRRVPNVIKNNEVGINTQLGLMTGRNSLADRRVNSMREQDVGVVVIRVTAVIDCSTAIEIDHLIAS